MSDAVINLERLGKRYVLQHRQQNGMRYKALRDVLADRSKGLARRLWCAARNIRLPVRGSSVMSSPSANSRAEREDFWALKDISFEVRQGQAVGIIGRNGAGKSTLLKILSRITEPTVGRVRLNGRVASLLEVGTGFHPELTGRENIYLNGAILGMSRQEIRGKFDEIVEFAQVERFLDTPVKRYSSGMYVRLAFAVAAQLESEILVVDEVLAVGDAQFQKKCLQRMEGMSLHGRTVLFVSHHIPAVTRLCQYALWLQDGRIQQFGQSDLVCSKYLANGSSNSAQRIWGPGVPTPTNEWVSLQAVEVRSGGKLADNLRINTPAEIIVDYRALKEDKVLICNIHVYGEDGTLLFIAHDWYSGWRDKPKPPGLYRTIFHVPPNFFSEGRIAVKIVITTYRPYEVHVQAPDAVAFTVLEVDEGITARGDYSGHIPGALRPLLETSTEVVGP